MPQTSGERYGDTDLHHTRPPRPHLCPSSVRHVPNLVYHVQTFVSNIHLTKSVLRPNTSESGLKREKRTMEEQCIMLLRSLDQPPHRINHVLPRGL